MPSPFPGMDPYLEAAPLWPGFQQQFVTCLYQLLLPNLADRYNPRPVRRTYHTEIVLFTSIIREEHVESFVEIRRRTDSRLVTLIDVVSPANKTTTQGRAAYLAQRRLTRKHLWPAIQRIAFQSVVIRKQVAPKHAVVLIEIVIDAGGVCRTSN